MNDETKTLMVELGLSGGGALIMLRYAVAWWVRHKPTLIIRPGEFRITWHSGARPGP
jgi:hypothetical protein